MKPDCETDLTDRQAVLPDPQAVLKVFILLKGESGQVLRGYFDESKLIKLVKHFVECEKLESVKAKRGVKTGL